MATVSRHEIVLYHPDLHQEYKPVNRYVTKMRRLFSVEEVSDKPKKGNRKRKIIATAAPLHDPLESSGNRKRKSKIVATAAPLHDPLESSLEEVGEKEKSLDLWDSVTQVEEV